MLAVFLALVVDLLLGDPPNRYHPVTVMGRWIAWGKESAPRQGRVGPLLAGTSILLSGIAASLSVGYLLERLTTRFPRSLGILIQAGILKTTFSLHGLIRAAEDVYQALARDDLPAARHWLSWHLVSRDTSALSASQVAAATIESVAENASDGIVAPLFYYALGGLPLALGYRFANTADAMLGYRDETHEWLGKFPARLDDALNWIPARLSAVLILLAAWVLGEDSVSAWHTWRRDAAKTASPNAGHPMSAMAGALGVELEKVGHYRLGAGKRQPAREDIARATRLVKGVVALATAIFALYTMIRHSTSHASH